MPNSRGPNRTGPGRPRPGTGRSGAARPGMGAGRRNRRPAAAGRNGAGPASAASPTTPAADDPVITRTPTRRSGRRGGGFTTRTIALAVVLLILTISYASSLRVYIHQRQDIAQTEQQIIDSQRKIEQLSSEISRWNDPNYVKTQARDRLGWVLPGETGYRVIGPDGKPVTGDTELAAAPSATEPAKIWYDTLWGSVQAADDPRPAGTTAQDRKPITVDSLPGSHRALPSAAPTR